MVPSCGDTASYAGHYPYRGWFHATRCANVRYVIRNEDRAGAVLQVLQELEAAEVNVGRLNVGRQEVIG